MHENDYYISDAASALRIKCHSISVNDTESLDERFKFTHTLNFAVMGYKNQEDLQGNYYVVIKDKDGEYYLLNPDFPMRVTYTFTCDSSNLRTEFEISTPSNLPIMHIENFAPWATAQFTSGNTMYKWVNLAPASAITASGDLDTFICDYEDEFECVDYSNCVVKQILLNETAFSTFSADDAYVRFTNDGFKEIDFIKNSASFTETFDGDKIVHSLKFKIPFTSDTQWQNKLLDFQTNKYAVIVRTTCGSVILSGFGHGLQPSYTINASTAASNYIEITLSDLHDQGRLIYLLDEVTETADTRTTWNYVSTEWECIHDNEAKYLLQQEFNIFGNPINHYKCLEGYEEKYSYLGDALVGTYEDSSLNHFAPEGNACADTDCRVDVSVTELRFIKSGQTKSFTIRSNKSKWSILPKASDTEYLTITPQSGLSRHIFTVSVTNLHTASTSPWNSYLRVLACDGEATRINITVEKNSDTYYFPQGTRYSIGVDGGTIRVNKTMCCTSVVVGAASQGSITNVQNQEGYISFKVEPNTECSARTLTLQALMCDEAEITLYVDQEGIDCSGDLFRLDYADGTSCGMACTAGTAITSNLINNCYYGNANLITNADIGDCCRVISPYAFNDAVMLETVTIGASIQKIDYQAFGSTSLTSMTINAVTPPELVYQINPYIQEINVPCESLAQYQAASVWSQYANIIHGIGCGTQYRTISGTPYCQGYDKWVDVESQKSDDGGTTWTTTATTPTLVESDSTDCGWTPPTPVDYNTMYLTFVAEESCAFGFISYVNNYPQYSLNSGASWTTITNSGQTTPTIQAGQRVMWRCNATVGSVLSFDGGIGRFLTSGRFHAEGNIMSMLWGDDFVNKSSDLKSDSTFYALFDVTSITNAENLILPATTLLPWCYSSLFSGCGLLQKAPVLSATTLEEYCYLSMFHSCTVLNEITCYATNIAAQDCTSAWMTNVNGSGTFRTPSSTPWTTGQNGIPNNFTRVNL